MSLPKANPWTKYCVNKRLCARETSRTLSSSTCQGDASPWIPIFWGLWGDGRKRPSLCLADTSFVADRPPTHFFVKKKIHPCVRGSQYDASAVCQKARADGRGRGTNLDFAQRSFFVLNSQVHQMIKKHSRFAAITVVKISDYSFVILLCLYIR